MNETNRSRPSFFKRKMLINKKFQYSIIRKMLFISLGIAGLLYLSNLFIFWRFNDLGERMGFTSDSTYYQFLQEQIQLVNSVFVVSSLSITCCLLIYGVFLSHRIAGPIENIKIRLGISANCQKIEQLPEQLAATRFRKNDYFHDLASSYNNHVHNINALLKSDDAEVIDFTSKKQQGSRAA